MLLLTLSIALLAVGPLLSKLLQKKPKILRWLDRITFIAIIAVLFLHVIPESFEYAGNSVLLLLILGFSLPTLAEKALHKAAETVHLVTLSIGMLGLIIHGLLDGLSLTENSTLLSQGTLPALVILHRLPVGLLIWSLLRPSFGRTIAIFTLFLVGLASFVGFSLGQHFAYLLHGIYFSLLEALVTGAILHVVLFRGHVHKHHSHK